MTEYSPEYINKLARAFYGAGYSYAIDPRYPNPKQEDLIAAKKTLLLIKAGDLEAAAKEAGATDASLMIFENALKTADGKAAANN